LEFEAKLISELEDAIVAAQNILLLTHKNPDGDALGSLLATHLMLTQVGKKATAACFDPAPNSFQFLPGAESIVNDFVAEDFDLVIVLDCGDIHQTKFHETKPQLWDGSRKLVKVDHHSMAADFGDIKLVYPEVCATSFILTHLFEVLGINITPEIATCLLTGISTDTGSFKHSNTSPEALRTAGKLLRCGGNLLKMSKEVYRTTPIPAMKLWGRILNTVKQTSEGVTLAVAQKEDFEESGAVQEDLAGVVDYVNAVPDAKFSILLSERDGLVKASLRTQREDVNTAQIASAFGGGGHVKAAGFAVKGKLKKETVWKVVGENGEEKEF
jgi:phosphoesterase RecJ-like protein